jgi:hypothetical protein
MDTSIRREIDISDVLILGPIPFFRWLFVIRLVDRLLANFPCLKNNRLMRSPCCLCVFVSLIIARQQLGKHFRSVPNKHGLCHIKYSIYSERKISD